MKRISLLLLIAFTAGILLFAQESGKSTSMSNDQATGNEQVFSGWICDSKCVKGSDGQASCDWKNCKENSGNAVFVDEHGNILHIAADGQAQAQNYLGKHIQMTAEQIENKKELYRIHNLNKMGP
jgi:hypothetical protein